MSLSHIISAEEGLHSYTFICFQLHENSFFQISDVVFFKNHTLRLTTFLMYLS